MNLGKTREYFSSYYEGSLDRGLREGFERSLREDAQVQAEYRAFEATMRQLESLKGVETSVPADLHDQIMARIDRHIWESNQTRKPAFSWWKGALLVGAAAGIITIGVLQANRNSGGPVTPAGISLPTSAPRLDIQANSQGIELSYPAVASRDIIIREADGKELETIRLRNQAIRGKVLANAGVAARLLSIEEIGGSTTWVALPGSDRIVHSVGKGDLKTLALEIAGATNTPVVLQLKDSAREASWTLDSADADSTARRAVDSLNIRVELRDRGHARTLWLLDN